MFIDLCKFSIKFDLSLLSFWSVVFVLVLMYSLCILAVGLLSKMCYKNLYILPFLNVTHFVHINFIFMKSGLSLPFLLLLIFLCSV